MAQSLVPTDLKAHLSNNTAVLLQRSHTDTQRLKAKDGFEPDPESWAKLFALTEDQKSVQEGMGRAAIRAKYNLAGHQPANDEQFIRTLSNLRFQAFEQDMFIVGRVSKKNSLVESVASLLTYNNRKSGRLFNGKKIRNEVVGEYGEISVETCTKYWGIRTILMEPMMYKGELVLRRIDMVSSSAHAPFSLVLLQLRDNQYYPLFNVVGGNALADLNQDTLCLVDCIRDEINSGLPINGKCNTVFLVLYCFIIE